MDSYLKSLIDKYDDWIKKDLIEHSSKIIPIEKSIKGQKHILPQVQVDKILQDAAMIVLAECTCRKRYKKCDKPLEVCFIFNNSAQKWLDKGKGKKIGLTEAREVLKQADKAGLVHMTLYKPDHEIFALCSCCSCCCHDLQLVLFWGKSYITAKSDYIAQDDENSCIHCGECSHRCPFDARTFDKSVMCYTPDACYGCGLCITTCPEKAISLIEKAG